MQNLDNFLYEYMRGDEFRLLVAENGTTFSPAVTLTYALERLTILHVKIWNYEDQTRAKGITDNQLGKLKRSIDYLNGVCRPRLIAAIGEIFAKAVKEGNEDLVREPNLKDYKAR